MLTTDEQKKMSAEGTYMNQFETDLNGWKDFDPARGYTWTTDGPIKIIQRPTCKIRNDLLYKLHWPIFGPLSDIQVWEPCNDNEYTLVPFENHPMGSEPLCTVPFDRMTIYIQPVEDRMLHIESNYDCDEDRWKGPKDLVLTNSVDSPLTLQRFVTAVHAHLNDGENKAKILECINMFYAGPPRHEGGGVYSVSVEADGRWPPPYRIPEGTAFLFNGFRFDGHKPDGGEWRETIDIFTEHDHGFSMEMFLKRQKEKQRRYEEERQHYAV